MKDHSVHTGLDTAWIDDIVFPPDAAPTATTITPITTGPTNAASVDFTVEFNADVVNFEDESDLVITHTGTAHTGASITGSGDNYSVTVSGISGDGSFTLAVRTASDVPPSDVEDLAGNGLDSSVTSAAVLIDNTPPSVSIGAPTGSPVNSAGTASFGVIITGAESINLAEGNVTINHSGTAGGSANIVGGTTTTPTVEVTSVTGDGTYTLSIAAGIATDAVGNISAAAGPSAAVTVDNTPPGVIIDAPSGSPVNSAGTASLGVTVTGAHSINLTSGNVTLNHSGTAGGTVNVLEGTTATPTVEVSGVTGDGSYTISIAAGIATDDAGNSSAAAGPSAAVMVDNTPPSVTVDALLTADSTPTLTGTASDASGIAGVEVTVDGETYTASLSGSAWSAAVTNPLADGIHDVQAVATDNAGNTASDSTSNELQVAATPPAAPGITGGLQQFADTSPWEVCGTTDADTVEMRVNGTSFTYTPESGTWCVMLNLDNAANQSMAAAKDSTAAVLSFTFTAVNAAGVESDPASLEVTYEPAGGIPMPLRWTWAFAAMILAALGLALRHRRRAQRA